MSRNLSFPLLRKTLAQLFCCLLVLAAREARADEGKRVAPVPLVSPTAYLQAVAEAAQRQKAKAVCATKQPAIDELSAALQRRDEISRLPEEPPAALLKALIARGAPADQLPKANEAETPQGDSSC
jgi:hypothetical protein